MEFVYDEHVWVLHRERYHILGVYASEGLANQELDNYKFKEGLKIEKWKITRSATDLSRYTGTVGQTSKSN